MTAAPRREVTAAPRRRRHDPLAPTGSGRVEPPGPSTIDLHTHTTRSDGVVAPATLVESAAAVGVRLLALTDHDTLAGYREVIAAGAVPAGLTLIPGVEINAIVTRDLGLWEGELHILGFGMDPDDEAFEATLAAQRRRRRERFEKTVAQLRDLDLSIDDHILDVSGSDDDALGRPTVARALIAAGYATTVEDAFRRLLGWGMPGYVPRSGLGPVEAIEAIRAAGGLPALAHFSEAPAQGRCRQGARGRRPGRAGGLLPLVRHGHGLRGRRGRGGARSRPDRRQRLPRRHEHLRRGPRRAVGPARGGRRHPGRRARCRLARSHDRTIDAQPHAADARDRAGRATQRAAPPDRPRRRPSRRVPARSADPAALPRLDARLPDEPERFGGDGRAPADRRLRGSALARDRRPRRHQHLRDPRGRRAEGDRPDGPARPAQDGQPGDARGADRLLGP